MTGGLKYRSTLLELMDDPAIPEIQLFKNLDELDTINRMLGGHSSTISGIKKVLPPGCKEFSLTDVGCGGGDTLMAIHSWAKSNGIKVRLKGIDLLPAAIKYAENKLKGTGTELIQGDINQLPGEVIGADVIISSMVCHHLYDAALESMLAAMYRSASKGMVINDLHRHPLAFYGITFLTGLLSKSQLVRNDAPLSVKKGFREEELKTLLRRLNINGNVEWKWAFRYLVTVKKWN